MMMLYRLLLLLYPKSFRDQYRSLMEQAFRDQLRDTKHPRRLWLNTLLDISKSAPSLHLEENMQSIAAAILAIAVALFLGRFELHSDDTGVEVGFVLIFSFILGFWQPKYAWLYAFIGLSIPVAELGWGNLSLKKAVVIGLVVMAISISGTVCGVLARRLIANRPAQ